MNTSSNRPITETYEYKSLTKVLQILEQQRETAIKDKQQLTQLYSEALLTPIDFIEKLIEGKLKLPGRIMIESIPSFTINPNPRNSEINTISKNRLSNNISPIKNSNNNNQKKSTSNVFSNNKNSNSNGNLKKSSSSSSSSLNNSASNINKPWTDEEQEQLEKLLIQFPQEEVASKRWAKISEAMGSRTIKQVASRTQKYFIKLQSLGLPLPGSPGFKFTVFNNSGNEIQEDNNNVNNKRKLEDIYTNSDSSVMEDSHKQKKLKQKNSVNGNSSTSEKTVNSNGNGMVQHIGFKCDGCEIEPIVGLRWRCEECIEEFDLCNDCKNNYDEIGSHKSTHHMSSFEKAINASSSTYYIDSDYKYTYLEGESNYLDSNYDY
ncbi:myb domain-containing protein [Tieghemostelium lacteum]|uniref:Myb domain-containing protein n=1 Tax=Tieghemostelium lacteum TaxID=361077 RepID=A0A151ZF69_TIELA|nr:myb domain-containing protein [Tieghemostelium lacteum]|eukprot:KYQ92622.1 myb domain-containing protein [Tieghemostelium lacteum]